VISPAGARGVAAGWPELTLTEWEATRVTLHRDWGEGAGGFSHRGNRPWRLPETTDMSQPQCMVKSNIAL
jgi:hypothetical protein